MKTRTLVGLAVSLLWVGAFGILIYLKRASLGELPINAWGDFIAGAVAPLTLFWLVVGYAQQGEELAQNTAALRSQQIELENQVRETAALVEAAARQAKASEELATANRMELERIERQARLARRPILEPQGGRGSAPDYLLDVRNAGASAKRVVVTGPEGMEFLLEPKHYFGADRAGTLVIGGANHYPFYFTLAYTDALNQEGAQRYEMLEPFKFVEANDA